MDNEQYWKNKGEQIKGSVAEAIKTGDFTQVNQLVSDTVNGALREAKTQADAARAQQAFRDANQNVRMHAEMHRDVVREKQREWYREKYPERPQPGPGSVFWETPGPKQAPAVRPKAEVKSAPPKNMGRVRLNRVGSVSSVLYMVFGGIGMGFSVLGLFAVGILGILGIVKSGWIFGVLLLVAIFGLMIRQGSSQEKRLKRAELYIKLCGNKMYGVLEELAKQSGKSIRFIRKDIRKMLELGMFPEGHLDEKQTCFMLNDVIYRQYTQTEESYRQRQEEERQKSLAEQSAAQQTEEQAQESELNAMIAEGMECIRKLKELNDRIEDEKISAELFSLEKLLKEIFDSLRDHPEQMHRMHKLMDYYLPTTVKLVEAYDDFDQVSVPGEDILAAKAEIEKTLGVINSAFAELLNNLFQDAVLDATTDAQVLQTMLAKEGLTKEPAFNQQEK